MVLADPLASGRELTYRGTLVALGQPPSLLSTEIAIDIRDRGHGERKVNTSAPIGPRLANFVVTEKPCVHGVFCSSTGVALYPLVGP